MLNAGVIGLGVGESHISVLNSHHSCKVVKACDLNKEVLEIAEKKYPEISFTTKAEDILYDSEIDIVSIASYDNFHFEQIITGLNNNKHLFVEKPLVQFEYQAKQVKEILQKKTTDLVVSSNLILRQYEQFQKLKKWIDNNRMGSISYIYSSYNYGRINKIIDGWRGRINDYSIVLGGSVHLIDLILWLMDAKVEYVFALGNKVQTRNTAFRYKDLVTALLYFDNGTIAVVNANFGSVTPHFQQFELFGTKSTFINTPDNYFLFTERDRKNYNMNDLLSNSNDVVNNDLPQKFAVNKNISKGYYLHDFVEAVSKKRKPLVSVNEVFDDLSVCFAIEKSLKLNKKVEVEYL